MMRCNRLGALCAGAMLLVAAAASGAEAQDLFAPPTLGMTPPRVIPPVTPMPKTPGFTANQCLLSAGSCPTGRLVRSGSLCFCSTKDGRTLQGLSRRRPQGG